MFSGGIEKDYWDEMVWQVSLINSLAKALAEIRGEDSPRETLPTIIYRAGD